MKFAYELDKVKRQLVELDSNVKTFTRTFNALTSVISVTAVVAFAKAAFSAADAIGDAAARSGVAVDELSRLKFAAEQNDVEFQALTVGIKEFQKNLSEANDGNKAAVRTFGALEIEAQQLIGLRLGDQLKVIADQFKRVRDPADQTRIAVELFGRAGQQLVPLLNKGGEAIADLEKEADRLGVTLDKTTALAINATDFALKKFKATVDSLTARSIANLGFALGLISSEDFADPVERLTVKLRELKDARDALSTNVGAGEFVFGDNAAGLEELNQQIAQIESRLRSIAEIQQFGSRSGGPLSRNPLIQLASDTDTPKKTKEKQDPFTKFADSLPMELNEEIEQATREARERDLEEFTQFGLLRLEADRQVQAERINLEQRASLAITALREQTLDAAVTFLNVLGARSKTAASAAIAIQKARAIQEVLLQSKVAATLAFSSQLIPGDPTSILRAKAAYASTIALGRLNAGLIAATGALEIGNVLSGDRGGIGGTGLGTPSNPLPVTPSGSGADQGRIVQVTVTGVVTSGAAREIADELSRIISDSDVVFIDGNSAQAARIRAGS